jgi:hypothetical protein
MTLVHMSSNSVGLGGGLKVFVGTTICHACVEDYNTSSLYKGHPLGGTGRYMVRVTAVQKGWSNLDGVAFILEHWHLTSQWWPHYTCKVRAGITTRVWIGPLGFIIMCHCCFVRHLNDNAGLLAVPELSIHQNTKHAGHHVGLSHWLHH